MEWYGPLTVTPAIALLILSTSNLITNLNTEVFTLEHRADTAKELLVLKIKQLERLGIAMSLLYASVFLFILAGISEAFVHVEYLMNWLMIFGVISTAIALIFLFIHSYTAISVRKRHHKLN